MTRTCHHRQHFAATVFVVWAIGLLASACSGGEYETLTSGAVAVYNCQDTTGTSIANENGASGTLIGTTADAASVPGPRPWLPNALTLDGVNDYIGCPHHGIGDDRIFTIAVWLKMSPLSGSEWVVSETRSTVQYGPLTGINVSASDTKGWQRNDAQTTNHADGIETDNDQWHLVVQVCDGTTNRLYIDGVLSGSSGVVALPTTTDRATIGAVRRTTISGYFGGAVAGVVFSDDAWTAGDIQTYFLGGNHTYDTVAADAIAHYMPYGGTVDSPNDVSGNGHHGVWSGTAGYADGDGGRAFLFNNASEIDCGNVGAYPDGTDFAVSIRVRHNTDPNGYDYYVGQSDGWKNGYAFRNHPQNGGWLGSSAYVGNATIDPTGHQRQLGVTYPMTLLHLDGETSLWIAGVKQWTDSTPPSTGSFTNFSIGSRNGAHHTDGLIFDVMVGENWTYADVAAYHSYTGPLAVEVVTASPTLRLPVALPLRREVRQ